MMDDEDRDDLAAARGMINGALIGVALWALTAVVICIASIFV
jgi:hypothetical protein